MPQWLPAQSTIYKAGASVGAQAAVPPQQPAMAPMNLATHQGAPQTVQIDTNTFQHIHAGHPEPHPIALRHSAAHMDALHPQEDKIVGALMKLADKANEGKCTGEELGQIDASKAQLAQIQQRRQDEVQRLNAYMRQRVDTSEDTTNPGVEQDVVNPDQPDGTRKVGKDMQNQVGDASSSSSTGLRTTAQLSTVAGGWGGYARGLDYQQKAIVQQESGKAPRIGMESDNDEIGAELPSGTRERGVNEHGHVAKAVPGSGAITPAKPIGSATPSTSPTRPQGGTAKPNKSVFQKSEDFPMYRGVRKTIPDAMFKGKPFEQHMAEDADLGEPVTDAVGELAPDDAGDPNTEFKKIKSGGVYKGWYGQQRAN